MAGSNSLSAAAMMEDDSDDVDDNVKNDGDDVDNDDKVDDDDGSMPSNRIC